MAIEQNFSHRRYNPLAGEWILVSPQRLDRPWQGAQNDIKVASEHGTNYDPACYLCPGNARANGQTNTNYSGVYVFDNDYPALQQDSQAVPKTTHPLFTWAPESGLCRVLCFSPDHQRTLSELTTDDVAAVVNTWAEQSAELGKRYPQGSVQIFENKGELMGCSNPHPHSQIWAQQSLPTLLNRELENCKTYYQQQKSVLLQDYIEQELVDDQRVVCSNDDFVVVVPYWATWPFETLVCAKHHISRLPQLNADQQRSLADIIRRLSIRYDNLFGVPFPYSAGLHQAPGSGDWDDCFSMHMHFLPPLLRSAEVRKFMVGYELLADAQRDLTPEYAAKALRDISDSKT